MKKTWIDLLYELPVDATLREFLTGQGLLMPDDFSWTDKPETTQALIGALLGCPDIALRDTVAAKLRASVTLGDSAGTQAMFQVATGDGAALTALATCKSDIHRSFWLYVRHPELFDRAGDVDHFERQSANAQQHDLGVKTIPDTSDAALAALRADVSAFYQRELQCGDRSKAYVMERSPGVFLLSVHVKDLSTVQLEFQGDDLKRRVGNPNIHSVLERVLRLAETEGGWSVRLQRDYDPSLPELSGDADRLTQAVWNLVRNALQAGAANIILRTRVEHGSRIHDHLHAMALRVEIVDDGRGVPEALAEHLFLPLVSGRAEGSGLGLALSQQVAREHRGSLTYRSRPGHTVFTLLLPQSLHDTDEERHVH